MKKKSESRRLLVVALNYAPDLTGIGKYVSEMTEWLATRKQLEIRVVTAPPDGIANGDQVHVVNTVKPPARPATVSAKEDVKG